MANLRVDKITSTETFETTGSVQFDGANDHLDVGSAGDFNYLHDNTGTWTAEFWVCPQVVNSRQTVFSTGGNSGVTGFCTRIMEQGTGGSSNGYFVTAQISKGSSGNYLYWASDPTKLDANTWYHIALVYDNADETLKIYVGGKLTNSGSSYEAGTFGSHSTSNSSHSLHIGEEPYNNALDLTAHISNLRILNGVKLYTSNFKPPMRELEVIPGTSLLACQSKTDATLEKTGKTITANGNAVASELTPGILTPVPKAGAGSAITGSVEFNGGGAGQNTSYLQFPADDDLILSGDFTIELWIRPGSIASGGSYHIFANQAQDTTFQYSNSDTNVIVYDGSNRTLGSLDKGEWAHVAIVRSGSTLQAYKNGNKFGASWTNSSTTRFTFSSTLLGSRWQTGNNFDGFISNFRVVKGTALYTNDFIPPTRELKKVPGTVLLCCQDPDNPLTEATGKTITGYGDLDQVYNTQLVPNGDFSDGTNDWSDTSSNATLSVSSGQMTITNSSGPNGRATGSAFKTTIGARYVLKYDAITSGGSYRAEIREASGGGAEQAFQSTTDGVTETFEFQATHAQHSVVIYSIGANGVATKYDNVYVYKVLPGKTGSNFTPQVGDDRKVTFEGVTKINSDAYFYLPTGDTVTRESRYGRGLIVGGSNSNAIEYINISTLGNSQDYGDLSAVTSYAGALASSTRGVYSRSRTPSSPSGDNTLEYSTLATTSNSIDFGDRTVSVYEVGALSNNSRGIIGGGYGPSNSDVIDYITVASTGNAIDFGNLTQARRGLNGLASPTRGCFAAGYQQPDTTTETDIIDYVTIASTGNAQDFGDLIAAVWGPASLASPTRGIWAGGIDPNATDVINYVTISSTGNAQDFGDLTVAKGRNAGMSNSTRGVIGLEGLNTMDYITIATTGNAQDFGDMMRTISGVRGACSDSHGGLG